ncbi:hypothetical protein N7532_010007 [Penicillium argentinense]|uniref:Uncharacterized protein n=1 Tax=Penicillium argentinense TaxID=1131581 RepID=A0A9W9ENV1_9EURO|nr:uncharacterized protein N7532_010007 [Penicillium argentinense]KAJ5085236.1 hypothetical protein N7532_010007 [Penicillium argentinense]
MLKSQFQVIVDRLVRDLAQQRQVGHTDLLLLGGLEGGLLDLRLTGLATITDVGDRFGATKAALLFPAYGAA